MPTYEYKCDACGHAFEQFQSITAEPVRKCPACKRLKVKRLIGTGAGLIFKGSGFYITDYRDKSYTDKAKAESGSGTSESKGEAKTETASPDAGAAAAKPAAGGGESTAPAAAATPAKSESPKPAPKESGKKKGK